MLARALAVPSQADVFAVPMLASLLENNDCNLLTHHCQGGLASSGATVALGVGGSGLVLTQRQLGLQRQPHQPAQQQPQQQQQPLTQQAVAAPTATELESDNPAHLQLQKLPSESKVAARKNPRTHSAAHLQWRQRPAWSSGSFAATDIIVTVQSNDPESRGCRDGIDEDVPKDFGNVKLFCRDAGG